MFNLEQAIQSWKKSLKKSPAFEEGQIKEMETHLRDRVEELVDQGLSAEEAFSKAVEQFGEVEEVSSEVYKTKTTKPDATPPWKQKSWIPSLLPNYLKVALRNLQKDRGHSLINILGLSIGIACFIAISLFIRHELSFDDFHENGDRIYRIVETVTFQGVGERSASVPFPVSPTLRSDFPDRIETSVRFFNFQAPTLSLEYNREKRFNERNLFFTDSTFFDLFSFYMLEGNPETALVQPNSIVLTKKMAEKYFGDKNPLGKRLLFEGEHQLQVTGVVQNVPANSHLRFDGLISFTSLNQMYEDGIPDSWFWNPVWTYLELTPGTDTASLGNLLPGFVRKYFPSVIKDDTELSLQSLENIYLYSDRSFEIGPTGDVTYLYIFGAVAVLVLAIACINFMNLTTAKAISFSGEIGVRKVLGASRSDLINQYLGNSLLVSFASTILAIFLLTILWPFITGFLGLELTLQWLGDPAILAGLGVLAVIVGIVSGAYPAFVLSSFRPSQILRGGPQAKGRGSALRKTLVVGQFTIAVVIITGTVVAFQQLRHLREAKLGFDQEQVMMVPIFRTSMVKQFEAFKDKILSDANIYEATVVEEILGAQNNSGSFKPEGYDEERVFSRMMVRNDFVETFGLSVLEGRSFTEEYSTDLERGIMINAKMIDHLGWGSPESAIGKKVTMGSSVHRVIGIVEDFNFSSLRDPVEPFFIVPVGENDFFNRYMAVRINTENISAVLSTLEETWKQFVPDKPFEYFFLDDRIDQLYTAEEKFGKVLGLFSLLGIFIALMGLLGLVIYSIQQRIKEIGIRKVMGATASDIVLLTTKDFLKLILIANMAGWPLAYLVADHWLENFAYRTEIGIEIFLVAGVVTVILALATVGIKSIQAARMNPVTSLRSE